MRTVSAVGMKEARLIDGTQAVIDDDKGAGRIDGIDEITPVVTGGIQRDRQTTGALNEAYVCGG